MKSVQAILACWTLAALPALASEPKNNVSAATRDEQGFLIHRVQCDFQSQPTLIRVLLPDAPSNSPRPTIYVLPVEAGTEQRYGDGLVEIQRRDLHNQHSINFVAPTFAQLPWYADHPSDPGVRQESYVLQVVVPFIERTYPALAEPRGRLLLGFSKSGWGAWTLLMRHPDVFGRAAAWDAPLAMAEIGRYGSGPIFGTAENFREYEVFRLIERQAAILGQEKRLILLGRGGFAEDLAATQRRLDELKIPHVLRGGPQRKHDWHSGWVDEAVDLLIAPATR